MWANATTVQSLPLNASVKRRRENPILDDGDNAENVDPSDLISTKKAKTSCDDSLKPNKAQHSVLKDVSAAFTPAARPVITPRRLEAARSPTQFTLKPTNLRPASSSNARSLKKKGAGILSRRRVSSPFTRIDPPSYGRSSNAPFSIDAALSGTVSTHKPEPVALSMESSNSLYPKNWMFHIHEDSHDQEMSNIMEFSTQILDISDDEGRQTGQDERGKENIPPHESMSISVGPITTAAHVTRKVMTVDEPRTPLGNLDAIKFYGEGCNSESYVLIPGDDSVSEKSHTTAAVHAAGPLPSIAPVHSESVGGWKDLLAQLVKSNGGSALGDADDSAKPEIEIWESESAKDDQQEPVQNMVDASANPEDELRKAEVLMETS